MNTLIYMIQGQLNAGINEQVVELEKANRVHHLLKQAVVRREAKTTKIRIAYDACSKEDKTGTSLNDCLH